MGILEQMLGIYCRILATRGKIRRFLRIQSEKTPVGTKIVAKEKYHIKYLHM